MSKNLFTDGQTTQNYSLEPQKKYLFIKLIHFDFLSEA